MHKTAEYRIRLSQLVAVPVPTLRTGLADAGMRGGLGWVLARVRRERHNPWSIATLRQTIARVLLRQLSGCPFCGAPFL
jgi:hypothetical protein